MKTFELVIAGGGLAAARAIRSYREAGGEGRIALLSREPTLPYHRPPLSKRYLRGETEAIPYVEDDSFYRDHDVEVLLETTVAHVDAVARAVTAAGGTRFSYDQLVLATGALPRRLGVPGAGVDGVFGLRTVSDSAAIRDAARAGGRAVVVGGGFIGMEAAASLRQLGLAVTLIHLGRGLFDQLGSEQLSEELVSLYRERDVELLLGEKVVRFGGNGRLAFVETASGRRVTADLAVVGVGVVPATGFLAESGLALDNGVVVNERFETNAPGVYAVGDVANFLDPLYGRRRRIEHWSNARYQGDAVGKILAGEDARYDTVSSFFSEIFGHSLKVFGDVSRFDTRVVDGSLHSSDLVTLYGERERLVGALTSGADQGRESLLGDLIRAGESLAAAAVAMSDRELAA